MTRAVDALVRRRSLLQPWVLGAFAASLSLAALLALAAAGPARAATHIGTTTYTTNTTWTPANSPYVLDGNVRVNAGVTLTIEPGVIVKFNGQFRTLTINGTLNAVGTAADHIIFTSYQDDSAGGDTNGDGASTAGAPGQWYHTSIEGSGSQLGYIDIRYGGYGSAQGYAPIYVYGNGYGVTIDHAVISNNNQSAVVVGNRASATIKNSTLSNNAYGVYVNAGTASIDHTTISNNSSRGMWFNLPTLTPAPATSTITSSDITQNGGYGVYITANLDYPLASMPTGTTSNIYANNANGNQLYLAASFKRAEVNWRGNYWGDNVYYWYGAGGCAGTAPNSPGHLAYRSSTGNVPAGPISSGSYLAGSSWCGYDSFKIDECDFYSAKLDGQTQQAWCQSFGSSHGRDATVELADPVNSATGSFEHAETDLSLPGSGVPFTFTRSYNSLDLGKADLGQGWAHTLSAVLSIRANGDVTLRGEDGQKIDYARQQDGSFVGAPGALSKLEAVTEGYDLTRTDQVKYHFDAQGRLMSMVDRNGQGLTLAYGGDGKLETVTDAAERTITFAHDANGLLTSITVPSVGTVSYGYTNARLTSYTDLRGKIWTYAYDSHGFLASETDPLSHRQFQNTYGDDGRVTQQLDALDNATTFSWNQSTQTETVTDPNDHVWKDVYANNVLTKRIDPQNDTTEFAHNASLDETGVTAPGGDATTMSHDTRGNLLTATAPPSLGSVQKTFVYDAKNNVTSVTDARNKTSSYGYDAAGNRTSVTLDGQQVAAYTYNGEGEVLTATDGNGKTTTNTYDGNGNLASVTDPLGDKTTFTYDSAGRVLSKIDPLGNCSGCTPADHTTTYSYDNAGNLLTEADQLGHTTSHTYDDAGRETGVTDPNGHTTSYTYDNANHLTQITGADPDGAGPLTAPITTFTYDAAGNKVTMVDPRGNVAGGNPASYTTSYSYDANNRLASTTTPKGEKTTYTYDANGNLASTVDPRGNVQGANPDDYKTTYSYDAAGRLVTSTDPLGNVTTNHYDSVGNLAWTKDANLHQTSYTYDAAGRILTVTAPDTGITTYIYDNDGNQLTRTDDNNHTTTNTYNDGGQLTQTTEPDPDGNGPLAAAVTTYAYDADGNVATKTDPNGNATQTAGDGTTSYGYDRANRLTSIAYSDNTPDVSYSYGAAGNRTGMSDGAGTVTYTYDNLDRLTDVARGNDTFSYSYDVDGNTISRTYPDGTVTTYSYDEDNRLATTTSDGNTTSYSYDLAGHLTGTTLPSGNGYTETRSYDRAGRLTEIESANASGTLSDFISTLDPVGNPVQVVRSGTVAETATYMYDPNDRLLSVCFQASCPNESDPYIRWTYDHVGNRLTETRPSGTSDYTYDNADELIAVGNTNNSYDNNGNQTARGSTTLTYDLANRLKTFSAGSPTTTYSYDGDGNRLQASTGALASLKTNYLWDTNFDLPQLALERDGNDTPLRHYTYGVRRISMTTNGDAHYYHYDTIGSAVNLTSANGTSEWTDVYEPFGAVYAETQNDPNAPANPFRFAGEYNDSTGLYNLRARLYDPTSGRMLTEDPVTSPQLDPYTSAYVYAGDQPTTMIDPSGQTFTPSDAAAAAAEYVTSSCTRILAGRKQPPIGGKFASCSNVFAKNIAAYVTIERVPKKSGEDQHGRRYIAYEIKFKIRNPFKSYAGRPGVVDVEGTGPQHPKGPGRIGFVSSGDKDPGHQNYSLHTIFRAYVGTPVGFGGAIPFDPPIRVTIGPVTDTWWGVHTAGGCMAT